MTTQTFTETLVVETCCSCHVTFGMTRALQDARRNDHATFWCPNGHRQHYTGKSDAERADELRANAVRRLEWAEARERALRDQYEAERRSAAAYKGHATRLRNLIARGVCPCCRRNFSNVRDHMRTEHPDFAAPTDGAS